jgi:hypothetical protein
MKKANLFFKTLWAGALGMILAGLFAFNPLAGAAASIFGSSLISTSGVAATGLDLSELVDQLGNYMRMYQSEIWRAATSDIQLENLTRKVANVTDEYVVPQSRHTELLQPFQSDFTPKGTVAFDARINKVRQIKLDMQLKDMDDLYRTYLAFMADESQTRDKWPLVKYIVMNHLVPGIREEIAMISARGEYAAPVAGTPGASLASTDGFLTIINNEIADNNLQPLTTGLFEQDTIIDQFEEWMDQIPVKYRNIATPIICAPEVKMMYARAYRNKYGANQNYNGEFNRIVLDGTQKELIAVDEFAGTHRIIHTTKGNMLTMYDKVYAPNSFEVEKEKRVVNVMADFKRGYGFGSLTEVFTNDVDTVNGGEGE